MEAGDLVQRVVGHEAGVGGADDGVLAAVVGAAGGVLLEGEGEGGHVGGAERIVYVARGVEGAGEGVGGFGSGKEGHGVLKEGWWLE